jgi:hypothetical protein
MVTDSNQPLKAIETVKYPEITELTVRIDDANFSRAYTAMLVSSG